MQTPLLYPKWRRLTGGALLLLISLLGVGPASADGPHCTAPYVQVQNGATPLLPDPNMNYTIVSVSMGEPFVNCGTKRLTVVMKVPSLAPAAPPNASWTVDFVTNATSDGASRTIFVEYSTTINPAGGFNWGFHDTINDINLSQCLPLPGQPCEVTGTATPDGTITMHFVLTNALPLSGLNGEPFGSLGGAAWTPGKILTLIRGHTDLFVGAGGTGFSVANAATTGDGTYTVQGNISCSAAPVAALVAVPTSGPAPLMVNFDASASTNIGGCGTINSYIFDFGDGQQTTQSSPMVSHTYMNPGTYPARVRVMNSVGVTSANIAEQVIMVSSTGGGPLVQSIVSHKTHGAAGDFDIVLPQSGTPAIECRTGGGSGNHTLILTFLNNLVSVASASVTTGTGSVSNSTIGPNTNQYTVDLTGVTNAQTITVTLQNALDSTGALGNISATMSVLLGDTTGNGTVNSSDIGLTKVQSGASASAENFRTDVTVNGTINSSDIGTVKSSSGTSLPPP